MSLPYQDLFNFIGNRYQPAPRPAVRNVQPYVAPPPPPPVPVAPEVRPATPASPTAAAVSAATANPFIDRPNPLTTDQSLYTPILPPVQQPFDFSQYKMPEAPRFQMPEAMPQRDIAMERRQIARGSLRSALLGALLGGGAGALGAMTGAQQGMQQAYDQQYGQEMADYQNRMRMLDLQNQQAQADYNRQLQERGVRVNEALQLYGQQGTAQTVAAQNQDALRRGRLAFAEAVAAGDKERARLIENVMSNAIKIDPEDQARFIQFGLTGDPNLAAGGFRPAAPAGTIPMMTPTAALTAMNRLRENSFVQTRPEFEASRNSLAAVLEASGVPANIEMANQVRAMQWTGKPATIAGKKAVEGGQVAARRTGVQEGNLEQTKRRNDEIARHNRVSEEISRGNLAVARINAEISAKRAQGKPATLTKGQDKIIVDQFKYIRDQIIDATNKLSKPGYETEILGGEIRRNLKTYRDNLKAFAAEQAMYNFGNLDTGIPTMSPKKGAVASPASPNPPAGGSGNKPSVTKTRNGLTITVE